MTAHNAAALDEAKIAAWAPLPGSADADLLDELAVITPRARDLARNNGVASGAMQTLTDNIVGAQLRLSATIDYRLLGRDKAWAREVGNVIEGEFRTWSDSTECDAARTLPLLGLTTQALRGTLLNSDALALPLWRPRPMARWATRLMVIEADRLSTPPGLVSDPRIRGGVEVDDDGAPVAYHIQKQHPGDRYGLGFRGPEEWERIPAFTEWGRRRVIHLHDKERAEQSRGKPILTAVMADFKLSGNYLGAELHAAVANALVAGFLESDLSPDAVADLFGADANGDYWKDVAQKYNRKKMESGLFMTLPVGTRMSGFTPGRPNTAFDGFMTSVLRHIAAGLNIPYELLMKDFSKTNYSSARASMLEAWRYFLGRRRWLVDYWLSPIYELWLEEAINLGRVPITPAEYYANPFAWRRCRWIFAGRGWVDPVKEIEAAQLRIQSGLSTHEMECAEQGLDWEEVFEQRAAENLRAEELGIEFAQPSAPRSAVSADPAEAEAA
ncbi:phage portal protein [Methylolobus aquaticus]